MKTRELKASTEHTRQIISELETIRVPSRGFYLTQLHDAIHNLRLLEENLTCEVMVRENQRAFDATYMAAGEAA